VVRAAIFNLLATDPILSVDFQIGPDRIWPTKSLDTAPRSGYFLVLRWGEKEDILTDADIDTHGPESLTVWVHRARTDGIDFVGHKRILERVRAILTSAHHVAGEDGTFTLAKSQGTSPDFEDGVFGTTTKNATFRILGR
jgi:hypothetical protein